VVVEEAVDLGDDRCRRAAHVGSAERCRDGEAGGLACFEADVHGDVVTAQEGDVVDEEANHAFAFPVGRARVGPQRREVGGNGGYLGAFVVSETASGGAVSLVVLSCR